MSTYLEEFKKRDPFQMVDDKTKNAILKLMANDKQKNAQGTNYAGSYTGISIPQNGNNKFAPKPIKPTTQNDPFLEGLRDKEKNTQKPTKKDAKGDLFLEGFWDKYDDESDATTARQPVVKKETAKDKIDAFMRAAAEKSKYTDSGFKKYKPSDAQKAMYDDVSEKNKWGKLLNIPQRVYPVNRIKKAIEQRVVNAMDSTGKVIDVLTEDAIESAVNEQWNEEKTYPEPNLHTYNIGGQEIAFNSADKRGVGTLPGGGEVIHGDLADAEKVAKFKEALAKDPSMAKDYEVYDATEFLDKFMNRRAEEFEYLKTAPLSVRCAVFYFLVKSGSSGDLKSQPGFKERDFYLYNGEILHREDLGNIAYGHLGKVLGIPEVTLRMAAGYAQTRDNDGINWNWIAEFFDEPRDGKMIERGFRLHDKYGNDVNESAK